MKNVSLKSAQKPLKLFYTRLLCIINFFYNINIKLLYFILFKTKFEFKKILKNVKNSLPMTLSTYMTTGNYLRIVNVSRVSISISLINPLKWNDQKYRMSDSNKVTSQILAIWLSQKRNLIIDLRSPNHDI